MLFRMHAHVPPAVEGGRIDRNDSIFICQLVEACQPLDVVRILIHPMQQDHYRIVLLGIVALRQPHHEVPIHIVDRHLFLGFLRPERGTHAQEWKNGHGSQRTQSAQTSSFHRVSRKMIGNSTQTNTLAWKRLVRLLVGCRTELSALGLRIFYRARLSLGNQSSPRRRRTTMDGITGLAAVIMIFGMPTAILGMY